MIHSFINHYHVVWVFGFLLLFLFLEGFLCRFILFLIFDFWCSVPEHLYRVHHRFAVAIHGSMSILLTLLSIRYCLTFQYYKIAVLIIGIIQKYTFCKKKKCSRTIKFRKNRSILELLSYCSSHKLRSLSILCKDYKTNSDYQECKWAKLKSFVGCPNTTGINEIIQYVLALRVLYPL